MIARRQLPAYSPVSLAGLVAAVRAALSGGDDCGSDLSALLRATLNARSVVLTNTGTSALSLAIRAVARGRPDAIIALPAYGCYDLASAAAAANVRVVLYDLRPADLAPDPVSLRAALEAGARAVVLAPLFGLAPPLRGSAFLIREAGAVAILDAAQALHTQLAGRPIASLGSLSTVSFGRGKGCTGGGGGGVLAHDVAGEMLLRDAAAPLPATGTAGVLLKYAALLVLGRPMLYGIPAALPALRLGETIYHPPRDPERMPAAAQAALRAAWSASQRESEIRRRNAEWLLQEIYGRTHFRSPARPGTGHTYLRLPLLLPRDAVQPIAGSIARRLGIARGYPLALCDLPALQPRLVHDDHDFPGARRLAARLITLPTHSRLTDRDLRALTEWLERAADGARETTAPSAHGEEELEAELLG